MSSSSSGSFLLEVVAISVSPLLCLAIPPQVPTADAWSTFVLIGIVPLSFFYFMSLVYFLLDVGMPESWVIAHKFQRRNGVVSLSSYSRGFRTSLKSWAVGLMWTWVVASRLSPLRGSAPVTADWSPREFALHVVPFVIIVDAVFFTTHYLLHTPFLYRLVHKVHHSFSAPFALAAVYAHPFEHLLSNVLSISAGPLVMGSHAVTVMLWACLAVFNTTGAHSGFALPHIKREHDVHHENFTGNFGAGFGLFDKLFGTESTGRLRTGAPPKGSGKRVKK
jgi:sterol desaturase/sphingolipid hydroxylase (fatty acid hydroxylase superfamily)